MNFTVVLDQSADNLKLVVRPNVKVGLHAFNDRLMEIVTFDLEHNLEGESLEDGELTPEIVRVLIDWKPDLHRIVRVLPIDLIEEEAVEHRLLHPCNVVIVADVDPVFEHSVNPSLTVQEVEANLGSKELRDEKVSLPLQVLNNPRVHLL